MNQRNNISNTFLAMNYLNLTKNYKPKKIKEKTNIKKIWDVVLNPKKYENEINILLKDKVFSKVFFKILDGENALYQPKLIAAASDIVLKRSTSQFDIEIIQSNKNQNTFYLILTLLGDIELPLSNLYVICNNISLCMKISSFNNRQAQMILNKHDQFFNLVTNPETEIFIR